MAHDGAAAGEVAANRELWTRANREYAGDHAYRAWDAGDITWGIFNVPEQQLGVLGDVRGLDAVELGCGTAYFSAWLAGRGARPTGVDVTRPSFSRPGAARSEPVSSSRSSRRTRAMSRCLRAASIWPCRSAGASLWCDPVRWVPEAARLLRAGGRLVFHTTSILVALCSAEPSGPACRELLRPQRETYRLVTGEGGVQFHPGHGEWITILRASGFTVDDLREIYAPPDAVDHPYYQLATVEWARQWPIEEIWVAHVAQ